MPLSKSSTPKHKPPVAHFIAGAYSLKNAVREVLRHKPHFLCETVEGRDLTTAEMETLHLPGTEHETVISLFAKTCYRNAIAENITGALAEHYHLSGSQVNNIHLCLHEAVINGVIHGNLSVPGIFKSKKMLEDYYEWIEARLATPALSFSRIQLRCSMKNHKLVIEVIDEGRGYQHQHYLKSDNPLDLHQGLNLIRASCDHMKVIGCGNHIRMEFEL